MSIENHPPEQSSTTDRVALNVYVNSLLPDNLPSAERGQLAEQWTALERQLATEGMPHEIPPPR